MLLIKIKDVLMLLILAAVWGASFLFIRISVPVLGPLVLIFLRLMIAGLALLVYVAVRRQRLDVLSKWKQYLILGILNAAVPFSLIATAELYLPASLAAILNATTPLFAALVAWGWMKERLTAKKVAGLIIGMVGVVVLVGWDAHQSGGQLLISVGLSLLAAVSYAFGGVYSYKAFKQVSPMNVAVGQQLGASVVMLPLAVATLPHAIPPFIVIMSVLGLALLCTAFAYLIFFSLLQNVGPVKALSVTFLVPVFGLVWGALFLGERMTANIIAGLIIILMSVVLVMNVPIVTKRKFRLG